MKILRKSIKDKPGKWRMVIVVLKKAKGNSRLPQQKESQENATGAQDNQGNNPTSKIYWTISLLEIWNLPNGMDRDMLGSLKKCEFR